MNWHLNRVLRRLLLPLFSRLNPGDVTISHHYTGDRIRIHSFKHKGYWFHGRRREAETMNAFRKLVREGDTVVEVGGHVGYVALYLASLVREKGHVYVFEPGPNNLPYIRRNVGSKASITLVEKGVGNENAVRTFYVEDLSGQNCSFVKDLPVLRRNMENAFVSRVGLREVSVQMVTLDAFCEERGIRPDLLKIDAEGFEAEIVNGAERLLSTTRPIAMIEIQGRSKAVLASMKAHGYVRSGVGAQDGLSEGPVNTLWLHKCRHANALAMLERMGSWESAGSIGHSL